jgi:endonuclease/exonuclease/phosphatase family metal-dependent hydrolase
VPGKGAPVRLLTLNVHKGRTAWHRRHMLDELRTAVRSSGADVVCLQEVIGESAAASGPAAARPHYEYLADELWPQYAYGRNAVHPAGHHGNALLSRWPIREWRNHDVSQPDSEPRGLLHCSIAVEADWPLHVICVHLGLREAQRRAQTRRLLDLVGTLPGNEPVLVAGDFNDWRRRLDASLREAGLDSAFAGSGDGCPRTFPARLPLLPLDRVYLRGLRVESACVLSARPWPHLSDHLPLLVETSR